MATKPLPSAEYLRQCFDYDPATGALLWRLRPVEHFYSPKMHAKWVKAFAGMPAGTAARNGYTRVWLNGGAYFAHRLIWKLVTGEEPRYIDHINRTGSDLRWANLRECDHQQNCLNRSTRSDSSSGKAGVTVSGDRWMARITVDGQRLYLGTFDNFEDACAARSEVEPTAFGQFRPIAPPP